MKTLFTLLIMVCGLPVYLNAQISINKIAAYDTESSFTSGVYAISSSEIFYYSWYYQQWLDMPRTGLVQSNGDYVLNNIAVYNNKWDNSSGIFVFSDTAIFNYNWFSQTWYPLYNTGLPRNEQNKIDVLEMTVYGDSGFSSNSELFVLARTGIYRYSWYDQQWFALPNAGLPNNIQKMAAVNLEAVITPNPTTDNALLQLQLPQSTINQTIEIVFIASNGSVAFTDRVKINSKNFKYAIPLQHLSVGVYMCEIRIKDLFSTVKLIKI